MTICAMIRRAVLAGKLEARRATVRRSWSHERRVIGKAQWLPGSSSETDKANPRFVVTSLNRQDASGARLPGHAGLPDLGNRRPTAGHAVQLPHQAVARCKAQPAWVQRIPSRRDADLCQRHPHGHAVQTEERRHNQASHRVGERPTGRNPTAATRSPRRTTTHARSAATAARAPSGPVRLAAPNAPRPGDPRTGTSPACRRPSAP